MIQLPVARVVKEVLKVRVLHKVAVEVAVEGVVRRIVNSDERTVMVTTIHVVRRILLTTTMSLITKMTVDKNPPI